MIYLLRCNVRYFCHQLAVSTIWEKHSSVTSTLNKRRSSSYLPSSPVPITMRKLWRKLLKFSITSLRQRKVKLSSHNTAQQISRGSPPHPRLGSDCTLPLKVAVSLDRRWSWGKRTAALPGLSNKKARKDTVWCLPGCTEECSSYFFFLGKTKVLTGEAW